MCKCRPLGIQASYVTRTINGIEYGICPHCYEVHNNPYIHIGMIREEKEIYEEEVHHETRDMKPWKSEREENNE